MALLYRAAVLHAPLPPRVWSRPTCWQSHSQRHYIRL